MQLKLCRISKFWNIQFLTMELPNITRVVFFRPKRCKSGAAMGGFTPLFRPKEIRVGVNLSFKPSLLHHFAPLAAHCSPKRCKSFELHFQKNPFMAAPLLHHFTPVAIKLLHPFIPLSKLPTQSYNFTPLGSPSLTPFYPLWTNYPLTLHHFNPLWQPNSYTI